MKVSWAVARRTRLTTQLYTDKISGDEMVSDGYKLYVSLFFPV